MQLYGTIDEISAKIEEIKTAGLFNDTLLLDIEIYNKENKSSVLIISKETLKPIDLSSGVSINKDNTFLINEDTYSIFMSAYNNSTEKPLIKKTADKNTKTNDISIKTAEQFVKTAQPERAVVKGNKTVMFSEEQIPREPSENIEFYIEPHDDNCTKDNKPAVFAVKLLSDNYYLLFYRKSVYDPGTDQAFRKYLSEQPGTLVVYKYFHSIDSLRSEYARLGLKLRHNGRNELSRHQLETILSTFKSMPFL